MTPEIHIALLFSIIIAWGFICWITGYKFDGNDFIRELRYKELKDNVFFEGSETLLSRKDIWYKWIVRLVFLVVFIWMKIWFVLALDEKRVFDHITLTSLIVTFVIILPSMFPYLYYGSFCCKIHQRYPALVPEKCKDDLKHFQGAIIVNYKWRVGLLIVSIISLAIQVCLIFT